MAGRVLGVQLRGGIILNTTVLVLIMFNFCVQVSFYEILNEQVFDLLNPSKQRVPLNVRELPNLNTFKITQLTQEEVRTMNGLLLMYINYLPYSSLTPYFAEHCFVILQYKMINLRSIVVELWGQWWIGTQIVKKEFFSKAIIKYL